ncbi:NAD(P)/FAD-dependent oxidoreductase [Phytoactinopolyspora alkaliphila]|uniref:NAD(P)/FAD-dependent oxidoreductase n=1 Tax=Phytoactinopolyspora alkaliphila TaxID=1783498 RepID=A0A6N9YHE3_9ACTN|nr:FAD/NAD(P)-binding oxidoreductase [Phytoactinopolyspora alkaliphila]NED94481.1 NAD(P)/FAD-dependent oxidoreductase [Phytoactinopolyspora alkaliphila]
MSNTAVVLGAGFGGLSTASRLRETLPDGDRVVLVDRTFENVQGLSLLWLLRGWRSLDEVLVTPASGRLPGVELVTGTVEDIDLVNQRIGTTSGTLPYDALVVALGSELNTAAVPGLDEALAGGVAAHYYTPEAALDAHQKLSQVRAGTVLFLVTSIPYRCPAAPYEGAMLAADLLTETGARPNVSIEVHTPEPQPMPVAGPVVGQAVTAMLDEAGIGVRTGRQVERVDAAARQVVFTDGRTTSFDLLVVVPPHQPPGPVAAAGFSDAGWIPVDAETLATAVAGVWALGDVASITLASGKPLPKAAVFARGQGPVVAAGVANHLGYGVLDSRFTGDGHCYLEAGGHRAALGSGNFYHPDGPRITLSPPSAELHHAKEDEEAQWINQWSDA